MGSHSSTLTTQATARTTVSVALQPSVLVVTKTVPAVASPLLATTSASVIQTTKEVTAVSTVIISETPRVSTLTEIESIISSVSITITKESGARPASAAATESTLSSTYSSSVAKSGSATASTPRAAATVSDVSYSTGPQATGAGTAAGVVAGGIAGAVVEPVVRTGKGPFAPEEAVLGGIPTTKLDVPVTSVFLILFITGAITHFTIHELNGKKGHKFHLSDLCFDFCMVRTTTCTMRIVWAAKPANNSIVLAAEIFEGAGVVVLFAVNTFFTQRILRSVHPQIGWNPIVTKFFLLIVVTVPMIIFWNITNATLAAFLTSPKQLETVHKLIIFGAGYTLFLGSLPMTILGLASLFPPRNSPEKFGLGGLQPKILILISASAVLTVGRCINIVTTVLARSKESPGAINSKAVFYVTGFTLEILVIIMYAVTRIDLRFYVPDGCTQPGDYEGKPNSPLLTDHAVGKDEFGSQEDLIDVKMRMSVTDLMTENEKLNGMPQPSSSENNAMASATARVISSYSDNSNMSANSSRDQATNAINNLRLNTELVGQTEAGNGEEILFYSVKVKKGGNIPPVPQPPASAYGPRRSLIRNGISPISRNGPGLPQNPRDYGTSLFSGSQRDSGGMEGAPPYPATSNYFQAQPQQYQQYQVPRGPPQRPERSSKSFAEERGYRRGDVI